METTRNGKRIIILNRFGPFDKDVTGKSSLDLGRFLSVQGHILKYICIKESTKSNRPSATDRAAEDVSYLPEFDVGQKPAFRLLSALLQGFALFLKALFTRSDIVIVMTAPAMINIWGVMLKKLTPRKVVFWTMDLYPEAFASGNLIGESNALYKFLKRIVYKNPPDALICLGKNQQDYLLTQYKKNIRTFILPCGINSIAQEATPPAWLMKQDLEKIKFCYAGNLGEAHDEHFLLAFAQQLDPAIHRLYVNIYGAKAAVLLDLKMNHAVQQIDFLSYGQMHFLDVHVVSLSSKWDHVCVPSKAVTAMCAGVLLLLNSSNRCDAYAMFEEQSFWIPPQDDYPEGVKKLLSKISREKIMQKKSKSHQWKQELSSMKDTAFKEIESFISANDH